VSYINSVSREKLIDAERERERKGETETANLILSLFHKIFTEQRADSKVARFRIRCTPFELTVQSRGIVSRMSSK